MRVLNILIVVVFGIMFSIFLAVYMAKPIQHADSETTSIEVGPDEEFIVRFTSSGKHMMIVSTRAETFFLYRLTEPWNIITGRLINDEEGL
ncbi:hypothetical protein KAR91_59380 [Candidatus Pacearchaeota archaeon]|nr:hypothetical protein [Candidatus Pacearchaeota archaeon]